MPPRKPSNLHAGWRLRPQLSTLNTQLAALFWPTIPAWKLTRWAARRECIPQDLPQSIQLELKILSSAENNAKLLRLLKDVPAEKRTARFRCVIALVKVQSPKSKAQSPQLFDGACEGRIGFAPRGKNGFGYDPLFMPVGFEQSFAELGEAVKNKLSHRAKALKKAESVFDNQVTRNKVSNSSFLCCSKSLQHNCRPEVSGAAGRCRRPCGTSRPGRPRVKFAAGTFHQQRAPPRCPTN